MTMPSSLGLVSQELDQVTERMLCELPIDEPGLSEVLAYPLQAHGKRLRPAIVLLAAHSGGKPDPGKLIAFAAAIEMMHTATLVHDDLIDEASLRRGRPTLNQRWGNRKALFAGDHLFGGAAKLAAEAEDARVMSLFSKALLGIVTGEMRQSLMSYHGQLREEDYYRQIRGKTAALFIAAAQGGAILAGAPGPAIASLRIYGLELGMAFQILDDILDLTGDEEELGKSPESDLRHGTLTLPSIYFLQEYPDEAMARRLAGREAGPTEIPLFVERIRHSTAIERAYVAVARCAGRAKAMLDRLPDSPYRQALADLADCVTERRK